MPLFLQTLTLIGAFETAAQLNEEVKRTEIDGAGVLQKIQTSTGYISSFFLHFVFSQNVQRGRENDPSKEK